MKDTHMTRFAKRRQKLARAVKRAGADAILVTNFTNVTYLTGFTGDDSYLLVGDGVEVMLSDPRYTQQIGEECPGLDIALRSPGTTLVSVADKVVSKARVSRLAVEAASMTLDLHGRLAEALPGTELLPSSGLGRSSCGRSRTGRRSPRFARRSGWPRRCLA